jgi:hypothetical protein
MKILYLALFIQTKWYPCKSECTNQNKIQSKFWWKKFLLMFSKKCNEEKSRKKLFGFVLFEDNFINWFTHSPFLSFFLLLLLPFFYEFIVSRLSRFLPSFVSPLTALSLSLSLSLAVLCFYSTFSSSEFSCSAWLCSVNHLLCGKEKRGGGGEISCPCYKLISTGKWTRTGNIRKNISEVRRLNWDSKTVFLVYRIYVTVY